MNSMKGKVSIVIPCFNDGAYIDQALESAINQTYKNKEIIVVDDGSDLKTKEILNKLKSKIDLLIIQENRGPAAARNKGIKQAKGEYILVLDSDDFFEPKFCEKAIEKFETDLNIKMVTSHGQRFKDKPFGPLIVPGGGDLKSFLVRNASLGTMFRKQDWLEVNGYDENMKLGLEDWEFYIRLHENGGKTYVIPEILFFYRHKKNSRTQNANLHKYDLLSYIYKKHQELFKDNFELFVNSLLSKLRNEEEQKMRMRNKIEFELGEKLLKPVRFLRSWFK